MFWGIESTINILIFIPGESALELPTIIHFAAKYGLYNLCTTLLETSGSLAAYQVDNKDHCDPADIAESNGHTDLADYLRTLVVSKARIKPT